MWTIRAIGFVAVFVFSGGIGFAQRGGSQAPAPSTVILQQAPIDHGVAIPKEKLAQYLKDMDARQLQTLRMIEGGKFNVKFAGSLTLRRRFPPGHG